MGHVGQATLTTALSLLSAATEQERSIAHAQYRLRFLGDPVLKLVAQDVELDSDLSFLIPEMRRILSQEGGLGLAAQQVGSIWRVALLRFPQILRGPHARKEEMVVAINLRILARSKESKMNNGEGCLSVQGKRRLFRTSIPRYLWVKVRYQDEQRQQHDRRLEGLDAIIAQHECDHLDGKCIADGLPRQQRRQAERLVAKGRA